MKNQNKTKSLLKLFILTAHSSLLIGGNLYLPAAAAKLLQSCLTLCSPTDESLPCSPAHPWDSLGKNTGVGCHFLLQCMEVNANGYRASICNDENVLKVTMLCYTKSLQSCPTLCDPIDGSPPGSPAPPSLGFSRQEHWSGPPFPSPTQESEK